MTFWTWGIFNWFKNRGLLGWIVDKYALTSDSTALAVVIGVGLLLTAVISYLLGSVNFALVVSKVFYHKDIRTQGSGNAGATNITRNYGLKAGLLTLLGDGLKGVLAILIACMLLGGYYPNEYQMLVTAAYLAAFTCILGHIFPCFARFHGGKGVATAALCILALNPIIFVFLLVIFFTLAIGTKYVSLGSVVAVAFYPVFLSSFDLVQPVPFGISVLFSFLIAALIIWAHRGNLKRIYNGTERKFGSDKKEKKEAAVSEPAPTSTEDSEDSEKES